MGYIGSKYISKVYGLPGLIVLEYIKSNDGIIRADFLEPSSEYFISQNTLKSAFKRMIESRVLKLVKEERKKVSKIKLLEVEIDKEFDI